MVSPEELEKLKAESMSPDEWRALKIFAVCLVTALLAGITVVALNGDIEYVVHHNSGYDSEWDEYRVLHFSPLLQGFLGFLTMSFFLLSIYLLMGVRADRSS